MTDKDKQFEINYDGINIVADDDAVRLAEPRTQGFTCETVWGTMLFDSMALSPYKTNVEYSIDLMSHHKL